jgi:RNA polymerase sigma-70 factor (ECF subfamily)
VVELESEGLQRSDEASLVARARAGDEAAWVAIYDRSYDRIYRYVHARIFDPAAAEDVTAEVFVAAVRGIGRYRDMGRPLLAWLFGIAAHTVAGYRRSVGRQQRLLGRLLPPLQRLQGGGTPSETEVPVAGGSSVAGENALIERLDLLQAIERLPGAQREVLQLRYFVGLSAEEIAAVLGKTPTAVYSLQARAITALRRRLADEATDRDEIMKARTIDRLKV